MKKKTYLRKREEIIQYLNEDQRLRLINASYNP